MLDIPTSPSFLPFLKANSHGCNAVFLCRVWKALSVQGHAADSQVHRRRRRRPRVALIRPSAARAAATTTSAPAAKNSRGTSKLQKGQETQNSSPSRPHKRFAPIGVGAAQSDRRRFLRTGRRRRSIDKFRKGGEQPVRQFYAVIF